MEERRKGDVDGENEMTLQEVKSLKQDITQMKDMLASDMTLLESKMVDGKNIEGRLKKIDAYL
eukprot:2783686-Prorocentrum_lima.AAC.1